ncbi:PREDICTED: C-type lectin domain family 7 member A-like [Calidris pugnax]|uniref:C-type lectin domain family 7 member A-like n=1 Tax=Calidris pugnax TaxID=198806 RepID=UPI00071DEA05|nr:PREDICTED: C-type lectin domain family 7 member A-like [Calidris pugnax]
MTGEEVTYADLRFTTLEKSQDQELQTARAKDSLSPSSCWRLATVTLGVFCLSSVVAAGVLAAKFILVCRLVREKDENFTLQKAIMESLNQQLELLQAQNSNLTETVKQLASSRGHKCIPCPENWLQYGEDCYYFSKEWKTWKESKAQCSALESRFLKIESKEELGFIMRSAQSYSSYSFWIGLSHNGTEGPWLWEDGSAFSPDLFQIQRASSSPFLDCVWLQGANIGTARCGEYKFCICEKVVDPAAVERVSYLDRD